MNNPGIPLDLNWIQKTNINLPSVNRRAETLRTKRSVKKAWQAAWLLRAVTCVDLTTLSGDDTFSNVQRLCFKAKQPIRPDLLKGGNLNHMICVVKCVFYRVILLMVGVKLTVHKTAHLFIFLQVI